MQPQSILLTGATGFIGSHIAIELLRTTTQPLVCLVRESHQPAKTRLLAALETACRVRGWSPDLIAEHQDRIQVVAGDLSLPALGIDQQALSALQQANVAEVWHVASSLEYQEAHLASIQTSNVDGTQAMLQLGQSLNIKVFNYISTAYVAGKRSGAIAEDLSNTAALLETFYNAYEQSKAQAEIELVAYCEAQEIDYRIFRPSIIIGDSNTFQSNSDMGLYGILRRLLLFKRRTDQKMPGYLTNKPLQVYGDGEIPINLLPIDHFIEQVFEVRAAPQSLNRIFHIINPDPPKLGDVARVIADCLELNAINITLDDREFGIVDQVFRKSYDFYQSYFLTAKTFVNDQVSALIGRKKAKQRPLNEADIEKYVLAYVEQQIGVEAEQSIFGAFSRTTVEQKQTISADGIELTYYVTGEDKEDKPPLVLINAFGMDLEFWGPTIRFFKDRFKIVTWNLRGLPDSERFQNGVDLSIDAHVNDLRTILRAEGIGKAVLMGWCAGPKIALEYYRHFPETVESLVLVAGKYDTLDNPDPETTGYSKLFSTLNRQIKKSPLVAKLIVNSIFGLRNQGDNEQAGNTAQQLLSACSPSMEYAAYAVSPFKNAQNLMTYSKLSTSLENHSIYDMLEQVEVPTLIIGAENDAIAHPSSSQRLAEHIRNSELVMLPHGSHFCLVDNPGTFVHTVSRHLVRHQFG